MRTHDVSTEGVHVCGRGGGREEGRRRLVLVGGLGEGGHSRNVCGWRCDEGGGGASQGS
jgi:hypothetical protein